MRRGGEWKARRPKTLLARGRVLGEVGQELLKFVKFLKNHRSPFQNYRRESACGFWVALTQLRHGQEDCEYIVDVVSRLAEGLKELAKGGRCGAGRGIRRGHEGQGAQKDSKGLKRTQKDSKGLKRTQKDSKRFGDGSKKKGSK
jgi:hypothetical protein